jgi:hypothetical protein
MDSHRNWPEADGGERTTGASHHLKPSGSSRRRAFVCSLEPRSFDRLFLLPQKETQPGGDRQQARNGTSRQSASASAPCGTRVVPASISTRSPAASSAVLRRAGNSVCLPLRSRHSCSHRWARAQSALRADALRMLGELSPAAARSRDWTTWSSVNDGEVW